MARAANSLSPRSPPPGFWQPAVLQQVSGHPQGGLLVFLGGCGATCEGFGVDGDPLHGLPFLHRQQQVDFVGAVGLGPGEGQAACTRPPPAFFLATWLGSGAPHLPVVTGCQGTAWWHFASGAHCKTMRFWGQGGTCPPGTPHPPIRCSLEDHGAVLPVEGEVGDMDGAGAAVDGGGQPVDAAVGGHQHVGVERDLERPVNAGGGKKRVGSAPGDAHGVAVTPRVGR